MSIEYVGCYIAVLCYTNLKETYMDKLWTWIKANRSATAIISVLVIIIIVF